MHATSLTLLNPPQNALRNAMYDLKVEYHQLNSDPETLKIVNQISTCLQEQDIDPSSFFQVRRRRRKNLPPNPCLP